MTSSTGRSGVESDMTRMPVTAPCLMGVHLREEENMDQLPVMGAVDHPYQRMADK